MHKISLLFIFFALLSLSLLLTRAHAAPEDEAEIKKHIKRFSKVDENLYRGAQPDEAGFRLLKEMGIKRVINFRYEKDLHEEEKKMLADLGLEYVHIPWAIFAPYDEDVFRAFFAAIEDKDENPVFFHCKRGSERTGVASAAYRIKNQGLSAEDAYEEARAFEVKFIWAPFVKSLISRFEKDHAPKNQ
jgi:protein tyrosine/serine phosphatase